MVVGSGYIENKTFILGLAMILISAMLALVSGP